MWNLVFLILIIGFFIFIARCVSKGKMEYRKLKAIQESNHYYTSLILAKIDVIIKDLDEWEDKIRKMESSQSVIRQSMWKRPPG